MFDECWLMKFSCFRSFLFIVQFTPFSGFQTEFDYKLSIDIWALSASLSHYQFPYIFNKTCIYIFHSFMHILLNMMDKEYFVSSLFSFSCLFLSLVQAGSLAEEELVKSTDKGGRLSLKSRDEMCSMYIFPFILYWPSILSLSLSLQELLEDNWELFSLLWGGCKLKACRTICVQHLCHEKLEIPHLVIHWHALRLVFLCHTLTEDSL